MNDAGSQATNGMSGDIKDRQHPPRRPLASLLAEAGVASDEQLRLAVAEGMGSGERLGEIVLRRGWVDEVGLARVVARQWQLPFLTDQDAQLDWGCAQLVAHRQARALTACPVENGAKPLVALAEPTDERLADARAIVGDDCSFAVVTPSTLARLLGELEDAGRESEALSTDEAHQHAGETDEISELIATIDTATAALAGLRERVEDLNESRQRQATELKRCRERLQLLERERAQAQEEREQLARDQREVLGMLNAKLADAQALLGNT